VRPVSKPAWQTSLLHLSVLVKNHDHRHLWSCFPPPPAGCTEDGRASQKNHAKSKNPDNISRMTKKDPIPVTVLTGFLGSGKTTLLNHLLTQKHGYKCAIIINEFGAISIDNQLVVGVDEEILELNNGCLCCRVRGDLIKSLNDLFQRQKRFDYVLIETTGLADPSPVAHTFKASELAEKLRLDGVVVVADAKHLEKELHDGPEPAAQIGFADVILLNKTDLVSAEDLEKVEGRIRKMNSLAALHHTQNCQIDPAKIFNLKARELAGAFELPESVRQPEHDHDHHHGHHGDDHGEHQQHDDHDHEHHHHHHHDESVSSFYISDDRPLDLKKVEAWLTEVIRDLGANIYRSKGILQVKGQAKRVVFQGVQTMFDARPDRLWNVGEKRVSQLVFIGKDLDEAKIRRGFAACLAE
jgi:G3E family GTPase